MNLVGFVTALVCTEVTLLPPRPLKYSSATTNSLLVRFHDVCFDTAQLGKEARKGAHITFTYCSP
jgi:hypothetical protein